MSSQETSVAPKQRLNIKLNQDQGLDEQRELPLKLLMVGDYTKKEDETPIQQRDVLNIDKNNFKEVMAKQELSLSFQVPDRMTGEEDREHSVKVDVTSLDDFEPDNLIPQVAESVPEFKKLIDLRNALIALKGPLLEAPDFRKRLQEILEDPEVRGDILDKLGLTPEQG